MATVTVLPVARQPYDGGGAAAGPEARPGSRPAAQPGRVPTPPRAVRCGRSYDGGLHGARLTARGRVVVALAWAVLIAAAVFMVMRPAPPPAPDATATVTVERGDTLWGLATQLSPQADPRTTIGQIVELNALSSVGDIQPGQVLVVPAGG